MFTGIVQQIGKVIQGPHSGGGVLEVQLEKPWSDMLSGESVSVNGVCLTVTAHDPSKLRFDVVPETVRASNLGRLRRGDPVNLERALRAGDRLGGHYVLGHVDCTGTVRSLKKTAGQTDLVVSFPEKFARNVLPKGSIAVNGVSLTVVEAGENWFTVALIPFTLAETNLGALRPGDQVNLEFDYFGKWVLRAAEVGGLAELLHRAGFEEGLWSTSTGGTPA